MNPFARLRERMRTAHERNRLLRLDDRLLADIGLTRYDVETQPIERYSEIARQRRSLF